MRAAINPLSKLVRRAGRYRRKLLLGFALLTRMSLLTLLAWLIGSACSQFIFQPLATTAAPWQFELSGWLELAQIANGWVLAGCYASLSVLYGIERFWRAPRDTLEVSVHALSFSGPGHEHPRVFSATQIRKLRPLSPTLAWIKLALPRIRPNLLSTPRTLDGWFELQTQQRIGNRSWLFNCTDAATIVSLRAIAQSRKDAVALPLNFPLWRSLQVLAVIALLIALPEITLTLLVFYAVWRGVVALHRKRKRSAWERATQRVGVATPTWKPGALQRLEGVFASVLIFPLRAVIALLRYSATLLQLIPWRSLRVATGDGLVFGLLWLGALLPAGLIGFTLVTPASYSQTSPSLARILLARTAPDQRPAIATQALERALQSGNRAALHAILVAGARDGVFHLSGYQAAKRHAQSCRDALPVDLTQVVLDETPSETELLFAASCALNPARLQLALSTAAFQRQAGARLDLHRALASGNSDLLVFALDTGANLEQLDWRGRTPLLAALDALVTSQAEEQAQALLSVNHLIERGAVHTAMDAAQRSAALIAAATELPAPWFERLLAATPADARSTLGATLLHAAAASGDVARAQQIIARGTPDNTLTVDGRSALHFAKGRAMVGYLIERGLDGDLPDARGQTPFHHAVIQRDLAAARLLGGLAGHKDAADIFGRSALDYAPTHPKLEWVQWRELADILRGHAL